MKLTNEQNLPGPVFNAVMHADDAYVASYDRDYDISVTGLLNPPQQAVLAKQHEDELEEDASDRIYALLGQTIHTILENHAEPGDSVEQRLYADVNGWTVSGQYDRFTDGNILQDWKMCSVWESIFGIRPEREQQLNMLAWLLTNEGYPVHGIQIVSIYRDFSKPKAAREKNYPPRQVEVHDMNLWSADDQYNFIAERVQLHQEAAIGRVPPCTPDEQWAKETKYAVMVPQRKRALKLYDSLSDAEERAGVERQGYVETRQGERTRCETYCSVRDYCTQYAQESANV